MNLVIGSMMHLAEAVHHTSKAKAVNPAERTLTKAMQKAFRAQGKAFTSGLVKYASAFPPEVKESNRYSGLVRITARYVLREALDAGSVDDLFQQAEGDTIEMFVKPIGTKVEAMLAAGAKQLLGELGFGLSFDLKNPSAVQYIEQHGAALVADINQTTRKDIQAILQQATEEGWSYERTAKEIIGAYEDMAVPVEGNFSSRAERIAVTEVGEAYEEGNWIAIQDLMAGGVQLEKQWDTAPELSKTGPCPEICQPNASEGWIPADQPHQSGDDHPLGHVGCYCDELYRAKE